MNFQSHSQAGQDLFAFHVLGRRYYGRFLDVGSNHPVEKNNTYALQSLGWDGLTFDSDDYCAKLDAELRHGLAGQSAHHKVDVTEFDWSRIAPEFKQVDFLSLDVDAATPKTLATMLVHGIHFRVACVEHDRYRFGDLPAGRIANMLTIHGYDTLCDDIMDQGCPFEFWVVDPKSVDMSIAERFRTVGPADWREILRKGGVEV